MAANSYSTLTAGLKTALLTLGSTYTGLVVERMPFRPPNLPASFAGVNYGIIISPAGRPWDERRTGVREVQYLLRCDLFLLVRNFHAENALFSTTGPDLGLFEMVKDVKEFLRTNDLGGFLDKTYDEPGGDVNSQGPGGIDFQEFATPGFDAGEHSFVFRARLPFLGRPRPFCHSKVA